MPVDSISIADKDLPVNPPVDLTASRYRASSVKGRKSRRGHKGYETRQAETAPSVPAHLSKIIAAEFNEGQRAHNLFEEFFKHNHYSKDFSLKLIKVAKRAADSWDIRRLAALMLENQALKIPVKAVDEFDFLFVQLNLKPGNSPGLPVNESVLKEGYSTTSLRRFIPEFRQKLGRLNRAHQKIKGRRSAARAIQDFIHLSRTDCKLSLARYLFEPDEVVEQIFKQVRLTRGVKDIDSKQAHYVQSEAEHARRQLPDFEATILERLSNIAKIYWVSDSTSSRINSLVEYPLTAVVLVVKPPGSNVEFELKRAGLRGEHALSVLFWGETESVPPSHRLQGGSMQWLLRYESHSSARASVIYRQVHQAESPVSHFISRASIYAVPVEGGEERIISYFTREQKFGNGFREMREAMKDATWAFKQEEYPDIEVLRGEMGLTLRFLHHVMPAQAIITGTSSFRLDRLAKYLSDEGPEVYFDEGLKIDYTDDDARRLADEVLEEVLCVYAPPPVKYQSYGQYVEAALSVPENRARADQNYLSVMVQVGKFWGTLLAARGHSWGESFVGRNVGLRSVWNNGQWEIKIIFLDHDHLHMGVNQYGHFRAGWHLRGMVVDERYIWGYFNGENFANSEADYLQRIYRVGKPVIRKAEALALRAIEESYKRTQREIEKNPRFENIFGHKFVESLRDWDRVVAAYLKAKRNGVGLDSWQRETEEFLKERHYKAGTFETYLRSIEKNIEFLQKYSFLYLPESS